MAEGIFVETERLILRHFTMDDVDHIAAQDGDPEVMRYVADGLPKTRRDAEEGVARVLLNYEKFPGLGYGLPRKSHVWLLSAGLPSNTFPRLSKSKSGTA
jgi:hypothetical protein